MVLIDSKFSILEPKSRGLQEDGRLQLKKKEKKEKT